MTVRRAARGVPPLSCVPMPHLLARVGVLVVLLVYVLVLLRWGYDPATCLALLSGSGLLAARVARGLSAPGRGLTPIKLKR